MSLSLTFGKSKTIYFVTGSDEAAVKSAATNLADYLMPEDTHAFAREVIDGRTETRNQAVQIILDTIQSLLTIPLENKLVWLKDASMLVDATIGRSGALSNAWEKLQHAVESGIPTGIIFLLSAPGANKRLAAYKAFAKLAKVIICDKPSVGWNVSNSDIVDLLKKIATKSQLHFEPTALELLAVRVGVDTLQAEVECEKLAIALGQESKNATITETMVRDLVPTTRMSSLFDLANAILYRNMDLCLESLRQLFIQGESAIAILMAAVVPTVRNLLIVKDLLERYDISSPIHTHTLINLPKQLPPEVAANLPKKKDGTLNAYLLGRTAKHSANYSKVALRAALKECLAVNRLLISSPSLSEETVILNLLVKILGKSSINS